MGILTNQQANRCFPPRNSGKKRPMNVHSLLLAACLSVPMFCFGETHLFILSGQSNMAGINPDTSFTPVVEKEFGKQNVVVVKDAMGGQSIQRWYKGWSELAAQNNMNKKAGKGTPPPEDGDLYDRLMVKVNKELSGKRFDTVTFVWMQGEADSKKKNPVIYKASLMGLLDQLKEDLGREDINVVIGRLSTFKNGKGGWDRIRKIQVEVAESTPRTLWVDTDDIDRKDVHYSKAGYKALGERFAEQSIDLIKNAK